MEIYTVKQGDSLWKISARYNVPVQAMAEINGLLDINNLVIGMTLIIPSSGEFYVVQPGDSVTAIGEKFSVDFRELIRLNNLQPPYNIFIGQILRMPSPQTQLRHTVKPGDTLWKISRTYNIPFDQLAKTNNLFAPYPLYVGQSLIILSSKPMIETLGYYNPTRLIDKNLIVRTLGQYLTYLGVFEFPFTFTGAIQGKLDPQLIEAARTANVAIMPVITNSLYGDFSRDLGASVLSDTITRKNLIDNIIQLMNLYNLKGVIIDIENLAPQDRTIFTTFIQLLYLEMKLNNKILILNVPAKWEEWADKDWVGFFDFNALGSYIDIAASMTYEFGWRAGPPRPTVQLDFIVRSINYALSNNIPPEKLLLGFTLYGYDWELPDTDENLATTVTLHQVWALARKYGSSIVFDNVAGQPYMEYINELGILHKVWFEDIHSHHIKYELIKEYNLRGAFYWIINLPFPQTWYVLSEMFQIKKL